MDFLTRLIPKLKKDRIYGEYFSLKAPAKTKIAKRCLCLGALLMRLEYEMTLSKQMTKLAFSMDEQKYRELTLWIKKNKLDSEQSNFEREIFAKPVGTWKQPLCVHLSWRNQALGVLLWSINQIDKFPKYDEGFYLQNNIGFLPLFKPVNKFISESSKRDVAEIRIQRDVAENWKSICRQAQLKRPLPGDQHKFNAYGKPFKKLSSSERQTIGSTSQERLYALNWLCGFSKDWDEVPTDT